MKNLIIFLLLVFGIVCSCSVEKDSVTNLESINIPDAKMAAFHTDQYVWEMMARSFQVKTQDPMNLEWEFWATSTHAYEHACRKNHWPLASDIVSMLPPKGVSIINNKNISGNFSITQFAALTLNFNPYYEELRLNKPMFEYIQNMGLYNQNKVYKLAKEGKISFPPESMMIKAQWLPGDSSQLKGYYKKIIQIDITTDIQIEGKDSITSTIQSVDTLAGLVGFHLVTRALPNWVWSTFEYVGNVGMCDYIGCKDDFGCIPSYISPNKRINQGYNNSKQSPALKQLFSSYNIPKEFENYRLKGSQTTYTDNKGDTTILGNSILEMNLVPSSSCISCHARAALNNDSPRANMDMFVEGSFDNTLVINPKSPYRGWYPTCIAGTPIISDYINADSMGVVKEDSVFYQTNFLWQLAQHAKVCENEK